MPTVQCCECGHDTPDNIDLDMNTIRCTNCETGDSRMKVYVLTATIERDNDPDGDLYAAITTVHATQQGALDRFTKFLDDNGIITEVADWEVTRTSTFIGADPDPDMVDGTELHWGINEMEVQE